MDDVRLGIKEDLEVMHHRGVNEIVILGLEFKSEKRILYTVKELWRDNAVMDVSIPIDEIVCKSMISGQGNANKLPKEELSVRIDNIIYLRRSQPQPQ